MSQFVEDVLKSIMDVKPDEHGVRQLVATSYAKVGGKSVFMHNTDDLVELILDTRIPWLDVVVTDPHFDRDRRSLLATALEHWEFRSHGDFDERILSALQSRFTSIEICQQLAESKPLALREEFVGRGLDQRNVLLERLGIIIAADQSITDAWVDLLFREHRFRDECFLGDFLEKLSTAEKTTRNYRRLDPGDWSQQHYSMAVLTKVLIMAAAFNPKGVRESISRYTSASLYALSRGAMVGMVDSHMNAVRMAYVHAMYLLGSQANDVFVPLHVTRQPVSEADEGIIPALICVMAESDKPCFSMRSLIGSPKALNLTVLQRFITNYLFKWRPGFSRSLMNEDMEPSLRKALRNEGLIKHMFAEANLSRTYADDEFMRYAAQLQTLPIEIQEAVIEEQHDRLQKCMRVRHYDRACGAVKFLIALGGQDEKLTGLFKPRLVRLLSHLNEKKSNQHDLRSLLKALHEVGILEVSDFAKAIPDAAFIDKLVSMFSMPRGEIQRHLRPRKAEDLLGVDLGL